jgi:hypothetical protein
LNRLDLHAQPPLHVADLPGFEDLNRRITAAFQRERHGPASRHSHLESGRYENTYIERDAIPEIVPLYEAVADAASTILRRESLKLGFWFNAMGPGERTARHNHEEQDELLSCVYYLQTPPACGDLLIYDRGEVIRVTPQEGRCVFFPPKLAHEVERNLSAEQRLSVAFNFGPADG